jgi:hypothetical protein
MGSELTLYLFKIYFIGFGIAYEAVQFSEVKVFHYIPCRHFGGQEI